MVDRPKSEEEIYHGALEKPRDQRSSYVRAACGDDSELLARVESLLKIREDGNNFLASPLFIDLPLTSTLPEERPGETIDKYKLLEKIGEGGMAVVYMAEQEKPIRRKVALKIIKLGMDTKQVIARFEAERQALAMMDHPNIAKVLDAGATETGRPYFVMELVKGVSITDYCDANSLNTKERLELFIQVCNAVQHAHQKGIIHRDIKPTNVMVTHQDGKPVPKVIDFGIAKAINQKLTEKTLFTRYAHIIGTPAYMSPEQAELSDLDVDTRTDIYSLGVLLYELLTGTTPFSEEELRKAGYIEMQRVIREQEPTKPSTKLSTLGQTLSDIAKHRSATPDVLTKAVRGDLDWIVMKSLEKDRAQRYETVNALAMEIQRHLRHEPILAGSPGTIYRLRKFVRRNRSRIVTTGAATVLLAGLIFGITAYVQNRRVRWARQVAMPELVKLIEQDDYLVAFSLAGKAEKFIPKDPMLAELWSNISRDYSIITTPSGAEVYYKEYSDLEGEWQYLGRSPLENIRFPRGAYRWKIEKDGFETRECVAGDSLSIQLPEQGSVPPGMVPIPPWTATVGSPSSGRTETVEVPPYLIDKYEVTNEQFKGFVDEGGYRKPQCWKKLKFLREGRELSWEETMSQFCDKTSQPGPSTWEGGTYLEGQGQYPVCGVSWYEAAAYAEFVGKSLPTVYHWQQAACLNESIVIVPHSNFAVGGTAPVGSHPGMGHTGLYDMAGNVKEWCFNATDDSGSQRYILGGGWDETTYMFTSRDFRSSWERSPVNGFRCVQYLRGGESVPAVLFGWLEKRSVRDYSTAVPCSDVEYQIIKWQFEYDRTPLNTVIESIDDSSPFWRKEKITFDAAYGGERAIAYLFIPRAVQPPYQAVIYWPSASAPETLAFKGLPERDCTELIITSGRALLFPVYKGTYERRLTECPGPRERPVAYTDWIIQISKDLRRSIDYLETRNDIDKEKIAYYGMTAGALFGPMSLAVEDRFKAAVLVVGGFPVYVVPPAIDPVNHAPRVKTPVLMVNGTEDSVFPYETSQRPMYELLGTDDEHKQHKLYPGGHGLLGLFGKQVRGDVLGWLDRYLGPVNENKDSIKRPEL